MKLFLGIIVVVGDIVIVFVICLVFDIFFSPFVCGSFLISFPLNSIHIALVIGKVTP